MTTQTVATGSASGTKDKDAVPLRPFKVGVQVVDDQAYDNTVTLTASTQQLTPQYEIPATGFLNGVWILVEGSVTANTATAAVAFAEDGPWNVIDSLTFTDTNNSEIVGPIDGFDLKVITKWGGYAFQDDPMVNTDVYAVTASTASAGGSFSFPLRIPVELVPRDALGSLPNKSQSTPFKVKITMAASGTPYSSAPSAAPSVRVRMTPDSYWEPTATDGSGNPIADQPPGVNTTQYWGKSIYNFSNGQQNISLTNSVGFPVRNLIFVLRDASDTRSGGEADWPDPTKLQLQSNIIVDRIQALWKYMMTRDYNYGSKADTAEHIENGLYVLPFNKDFCHKPGWENRRQYLRTTDGMRLQLRGTFGTGSATHKLEVFTNYVGVGAGSTLAQLTT